MRLISLVATFAATLALPAMAQIGNPAGMTPGVMVDKPGQPAPNQPNLQDRLFVRLAALGGMAEVDLGLLAEKQAGSNAVKAFGRRMADDHSKANLRLKDLAKEAGITLPTDIADEHKAMRTRLEKADGPLFDLEYLDAQVGDHIKTAQLLEWEIGSGQDADIQHFASETLPIVLDHLNMAKNLLVERRMQAAR
jgi:putative membrane protein